jgi:glycosyltransferase involved in cell wall biosynthesis
MPIFKLLNNSSTFDYEFWAGQNNTDKFLLTETKGLNFKNTNFTEIKLPFINKKIEWQKNALKYCLIENFDLYIILGNPNSLSVWICVLIAKLRKIPILMWSHGYLKDEIGIKSVIRKFFYKLADGHLLYGNRAKNIMLKKGFKEKYLHTIYNSLDYEMQKRYRENLNYKDRIEIRKNLNIEEDSITLIVIGRLMKKLKIEQILESIKDSKKTINLIIVGDGPEKNNLKDLVKIYQIQNKVIFYGACHNEEELSKLYNASDYSVVMGKVGLAAMHSLAYGIPMITNDNLDEHFPEIEAIIDNQTGFYFKENNLEDFISKIKAIPYRSNFYENCIKLIETYYTPNKQLEGF